MRMVHDGDGGKNFRMPFRAEILRGVRVAAILFTLVLCWLAGYRMFQTGPSPTGQAVPVTPSVNPAPAEQASSVDPSSTPAPAPAQAPAPEPPRPQIHRI